MSSPSPLRGMLLAAIRFYRRRLSGRGPLRRLRCTFEACESCSAFGERAAREAPSTLEALRRILRRLQRCRHLSLYRWRGGLLGGGRGFDRWLTADGAGVRRLAPALAGDGEAQAAIDAVAAAADALSRGAATPRRAPALLVRDGRAVGSALAARWRTRVVAGIAAGCASAALLAAGAPLAAAPFVLIAALAAASAWSARRLRSRLERLERLEVLAQVEGPPGAAEVGLRAPAGRRPAPSSPAR